MTRIPMTLFAAFALVACGGDDTTDLPAGTDTGATDTTGGDADTDADSDSDADTDTTGTLDPTFTNVWNTVIDPSCATGGCHTTGSGGLDMPDQATAYASLVGVASVGDPMMTRVVPGDADGSYVIMKLEGDAGITGSQMPLSGGPLSADKVQLVRDWIDAGANND